LSYAPLRWTVDGLRFTVNVLRWTVYGGWYFITFYRKPSTVSRYPSTVSRLPL